MILLSAQNLSKTDMERTVLDDVSFFLNGTRKFTNYNLCS